MKKLLIIHLLIIIGLTSTIYPRIKHVKKAQYAGLGKKSTINGLPKLKSVNGHFKKTSKGYTRVNPYVKSR